MRIFVYGTLKEGFPNAYLNLGQRVPGLFRTVQRFPFYVVRLPLENRAPWLIHQPGLGHHVIGQVFEVDEANLEAIDRFEEVGQPTGYTRVPVMLQALADPVTQVQAFAYMKQPQQLTADIPREGPFEEYTAELAAGYWIEQPTAQ
ncbi:gamma-glutamylcyclotransferase family protein [Ideonella sp.]|uniref:gamma-glutamylcyclotransferase family protein n=1 Tax=Ideonella sp. TaxID=1929293 RepID=UPI0037C15CD2